MVRDSSHRGWLRVHLEEVRGLVSALLESDHKTVPVPCVRLRLVRRELVDREDAELLDGFEVPEDGASLLPVRLARAAADGQARR